MYKTKPTQNVVVTVTSLFKKKKKEIKNTDANELCERSSQWNV